MAGALYVGSHPCAVSIEIRDGRPVALIGDRAVAFEVADEAPGRLVLRVDGRTHVIHVASGPDGVELMHAGRRWPVRDATDDAGPGGAGDASDDGGRVTTPMPGKVVAVEVSVGDAVSKGQTLLVLESMKMQNDIAARADGTVRAVHHVVGDSVAYGDVLVEIDPAE